MKYLKLLSLSLVLILGCRDTDPEKDIVKGKSDKLYIGDYRYIELDYATIGYDLAEVGVHKSLDAGYVGTGLAINMFVESEQRFPVLAHITIRAHGTASGLRAQPRTLFILPYDIVFLQ